MFQEGGMVPAGFRCPGLLLAGWELCLQHPGVPHLGWGCWECWYKRLLSSIFSMSWFFWGQDGVWGQFGSSSVLLGAG